MSSRKPKKEHTLPDILYVYEEKDGDDTYFVAARAARELADPRESRLVGKYWLGAVDRVEMRVKKQSVKR